MQIKYFGHSKSSDAAMLPLLTRTIVKRKILTSAILLVLAVVVALLLSSSHASSNHKPITQTNTVSTNVPLGQSTTYSSVRYAR